MLNVFMNSQVFSYYSLIILEILIIIFSIFIIISRNPIISVLYLIGLFLLISIYLIIIGLVFIGLSYLLVYVGAVSILFLFILMLIDIRVSELQTENNNSILLSILISILYYNIISKLIYNDKTINTEYSDFKFSIFNT